MNLRPYQERAVAAIAAALAAHRSTLAVAPTGAGKSLLIAASAAALAPRGRVLVGQHRGELVRQNRARFSALNPGWSTSVFDAGSKAFARPDGYLGGATFGMVPSLAAALRGEGAKLPHFDLLILDEAHHSPAATWRRLIEAAREANPDVKLLGLTATPERGDGKELGEVFESVADQISLGELIESGWLVRPRALVADVGLADEIRALPRTCGGRGDYDMAAAARLVDVPPITARVLDLWAEATAGPAGSPRPSIFFCSTVAHAQHVAEALRARAVPAGVVYGEQDSDERAQTLAAFGAGRLRAVVNCMTLTEGFDEPSIESVVMLRPTAFRSLAIQCIGRGLRLSPETGKSDCLILDFGGSLEALGGLDAVLDLGGPRRPREPGPPPMKPCAAPDCRRPIPLQARECLLCGYVYPPRLADAPEALDPALIRLRPFDLILRESAWAWLSLNPRARIACSDRVWAVAFADLGGAWHAFGCAPRELESESGRVSESREPARLASGGSLDEALAAADAFLNRWGEPAKHGRAAGFYHRVQATPAQFALATRLRLDLPARPLLYETACRITARLVSDAVRAQMSSAREAA